MKRLIAILVFVIAPYICLGQVSDVSVDYKSIYSVKEDGAHFTEVVKCDSTTASSLYARAVSWLYKTFNSPKNVIQTENRELGLIVVKGWYLSEFVQTEYKLTIQVKDGRFRYDVSDIKVHYDNPYDLYFPTQSFVEYKAKMDADGEDKWIAGARNFFDPALISLKRGMTSKEEEW